MKKWLAALALTLLLTLLGGTALASEALDITKECKFKVCYTKYKYTQMTDGKYTTHWESHSVKHAYIALTAPAGMDIHGLYLCLSVMPESYEIQVMEDGDWVKLCDGDTRFYHAYYPIPEGAEQVRVYVNHDAKDVLGFNEVFAFSEGDVPDWVQRWEPTVEKADILFLATHPDDELLFFAGAIPTYAVEQQRKVAVGYLSYSNNTRRSELLNGLWTMGVRNYPIIGTFRDNYAKSLTAAYKNAGGETKVLEYLVGMIRQVKPEVIVTQAANGEYGHKQHMMLVDATQKAFDLAAKESTDGKYLESYAAYGAWQTKKLYLHDDKTNPITFDWTVPLVSMDGKTSLEVAQEAYALHVTQKSAGFTMNEDGVKYKGKLYDNHTYGLVKSTVGDDVRKDDFLENVYDAPGSFAAAPSPTPTPAPTPTPVPGYASKLPALNDKGFLDEGEFVLADDTNGLYIFVNETNRIVIERKYDEDGPLTWFEAELWTDVEAGAYPKVLQYDEEKKGKARVDAAKNATEHQVVFAMNTDYYTYRVGGPRRTGIEVRDGEIYYDDGYTKATTVFPNLDTLAIFPDGRMEVRHSEELTGKQYVEMGAETVLSFGPYLIRDGEMSENVFSSSSLKNKNPRCAIGMVEPGHYVAIMAEGRLARSGGITVNHLALLMRAKGCQVALNLDGGQTAVMCFMGKQLNQIGKYDGKTSARQTSEILAVGYSEQVGQVDFQ